MRNPHSLEKPAATLIATATLLAGMGLPPAALAADGSASAPSSSTSGNGADDKGQTNAGDTTTWTLMGAVLTSDDKGTLNLPDGQSLPTFGKRPDSVSVQGSDGTTIPLTLADAAGLHRIPQRRIREWLDAHPDWDGLMRRDGRDYWRQTKRRQRSCRKYAHAEPLFLKTEPVPDGLIQGSLF